MQLWIAICISDATLTSNMTCMLPVMYFCCAGHDNKIWHLLVGFQNAGRRATGQLSLLDGYKVCSCRTQFAVLGEFRSNKDWSCFLYAVSTKYGIDTSLDVRARCWDVGDRRICDPLSCHKQVWWKFGWRLCRESSVQVQSSLDQLFTAMEALVRRRNQDVRLVNSYLRVLATKEVWVATKKPVTGLSTCGKVSDKFSKGIEPDVEWKRIGSLLSLQYQKWSPNLPSHTTALIHLYPLASTSVFKRAKVRSTNASRETFPLTKVKVAWLESPHFPVCIHQSS